MNCFDIRAAYNGRTLIMPSDTDRIVFVNNRDIKWDDGSAVTTDEMVSFLKIYRVKFQIESPSDTITVMSVFIVDYPNNNSRT